MNPVKTRAFAQDVQVRVRLLDLAVDVPHLGPVRVELVEPDGVELHDLPRVVLFRGRGGLARCASRRETGGRASRKNGPHLVGKHEHARGVPPQTGRGVFREVELLAHLGGVGQLLQDVEVGAEAVFDEYVIGVQVGFGVVRVRGGPDVEELVETPGHALAELPRGRDKR